MLTYIPWPERFIPETIGISNTFCYFGYSARSASSALDYVLRELNIHVPLIEITLRWKYLPPFILMAILEGKNLLLKGANYFH